jgi:hypothetical protein
MCLSVIICSRIWHFSKASPQTDNLLISSIHFIPISINTNPQDDRNLLISSIHFIPISINTNPQDDRNLKPQGNLEIYLWERSPVTQNLAEGVQRACVNGLSATESNRAQTHQLIKQSILHV